VLCTREFSEAVNKGCPLVLGGPLPHVIAAKAIAFKEANTPAFKLYAHQIVKNARTMADFFLRKGVRLVTGGTENHLLVLDISSFGLTGRQGETALRAAGITANRNAIPFDPEGPWYTSGLRLGTPAVTTLGMTQEEMIEIGEIILLVLSNTTPSIVAKTGYPSKANGITDPAILEQAKSRVHSLLSHFPLYPEIF
jgi:glycine hydroxymethyltransferase